MSAARRNHAVAGLLSLLAACGPRTVEVEGLLELTKEVRSQRLALARGRGQAPDQQTGAKPGEQIQGALSPLRDALTQLTDNQRDLAARQTTLTQEMRRWTQLLAESMQAKERAGAEAMAQRLAKLEETLAAQDARHREVEQMLATALDRTAEQLEDFLRRVGADVPAIDQPRDTSRPAVVKDAVPNDAGPSKPEAATQPGQEQPAKPTPTEKPPTRSGGRSDGADGGFVPAVTGDQDPVATEAAGSTFTGQTGPTAARRSNLPVARSNTPNARWLWWLATCLSVAAGVGLAVSSLVRRIWRQPARLAPPANTLAQSPGSAPADAIDEPRESVAAIAPLPLPLPEPELELDTVAPAMPWPSAPHPASQPGDVLAPFADALADLSTATDPSDPRLPEAEELWATAALLGEAIGKLKDTHPEVLDAPAVAPSPASSEQPELDEIELDEIFIIEDEEPASEPLVQCRLFVRADPEGAARIRRVLGADPRVLANPAPQVARTAGEAEITFAVLPGLPAGERSVLEQMLRDTVA